MVPLLKDCLKWINMMKLPLILSRRMGKDSAMTGPSRSTDVSERDMEADGIQTFDAHSRRRGRASSHVQNHNFLLPYRTLPVHCIPVRQSVSDPGRIIQLLIDVLLVHCPGIYVIPERRRPFQEPEVPLYF